MLEPIHHPAGKSAVYRAHAPGVAGLHALVAFPAVVPPNPDTDLMVISIHKNGSAALLRSIEVCGRSGLLEWLIQHTGRTPTNEGNDPVSSLQLLEWACNHMLTRVSDALDQASNPWFIRNYQRVADALLDTFYGLTLNDTELHNPDIVAECIVQGYTPLDVVNEHAREAGLTRIGNSVYGLGSNEISPEQAAALTTNVARPRY